MNQGCNVAQLATLLHKSGKICMNWKRELGRAHSHVFGKVGSPEDIVVAKDQAVHQS